MKPTPTPRNGQPIPHYGAPPGFCRWCGEALGILTRDGRINRVVRWHRACVDTYRLSWPAEVRRMVHARDHEICRECGLDCDALDRLIAKVEPWNKRSRLRINLGLESSARDLWDADHITPLVDGGSLELANLQTLCVWCHRRKTAAEATARAARRRAEQMPLVTR